MAVDITALVRRESIKRWGLYLAKAASLVAILFILSTFAPSMPPLCLAMIWAALSGAAAIGISYHIVIKKARRRFGLKQDGFLSRVNDGRIFSLVIAFVISAVCVGGLILELPKWELAEWLVLIVAVPLYIGIYVLMKKLLVKEYEPLLQMSRIVKASTGVLFVLLLVAYIIIILNEPVTSYANVTEAFVSAKQPFSDSSSVLLCDLGYLTALVDGLTSFAMSKVAEGSFAVYTAWRVALCAAAVLGAAGLIGTCSLETKELKAVFMPLDAVDGTNETSQVLKRYVAVACVLPVVLLGACAIANAKATEAAETQEYTAIRQFVREQAGMAACIIDGKPYDYEKVQALYAEAQTLSDDLASEREKVLTPLINAAFDKRVENVDAYLDWYYSLTADYQRLVQFFAGTVEEGMQEQLSEYINKDVDESELTEKLDYYLKKSEELEAKIEEELAGCELENYGFGDIPEWLIVPVETLEADFLSTPLEPTQKFLSAAERIGISAGIGAITGAIAAKVVSRIVKKAIYKKLVTQLTEKLAVRGLLASGGTLIAPGVGTAIGVGVGVLADALFLKADEAMNRDSYKTEIVAAIEEGRNNMLDMVKA